MTVIVSRIVPWLSTLEYLEIYGWFYPSTTTEDSLYWKELAIKRVRAWAQHCRLPNHIEATRALMEAYLYDQTINRSNFNEYDLRLMYSMAIIRFVNLTIDPVSTAAKVRSMTAIAHRLNFPLHFIQLRHQATHNDIPSLQVLRDRLVEGIEWLDKHCWSNNSQEIYNQDDVKLWITSYKQVSKSYLRGESDQDEINITDWLDDNLIEADSTLFISLLLEEGNLIPLRKKKRPLLHRLHLSDDHVDVWSPLVFALANRDPEFLNLLVNEILSKLHSSQLEMSHPLQSLLLNRGVLSDHVSTVKPQDDSYYITLTAWLIQLINWQLHESEPTFQTLSLEEIASLCLKHPNIYFFKVLDHLHHHCQDKLPELHRHLQLAKDTFNTIEVDTIPPKEDCLTQSQLLIERTQQHLIERDAILENEPSVTNQDVPSPTESDATSIQLEVRQMPEEYVNSPWQKPHSSHWEPCYIGYTSDQVPDLTLPLEWDHLNSFLPAYLQSE